MHEDEIRQLESEILRHYAMADITAGLIRADHLNAARTLYALLERLGGDRSRQKSKSAKSIVLHPLRLLGRKRVKRLERKSHGS